MADGYNLSALDRLMQSAADKPRVNKAARRLADEIANYQYVPTQDGVYQFNGTDTIQKYGGSATIVSTPRQTGKSANQLYEMYKRMQAMGLTPPGTNLWEDTVKPKPKPKLFKLGRWEVMGHKCYV